MIMVLAVSAATAMSQIARLTVATTSGSRVHFDQLARFDSIDHVPYCTGTGVVDFDAFGVEGFNSPPAHTNTHDGVDFVMGELVHRVTRPVTVMSVTVVEHLDFAGVRIDERETRRRSEVITDGVVETGVAVGRNTCQHQLPRFPVNPLPAEWVADSRVSHDC